MSRPGSTLLAVGLLLKSATVEPLTHRPHPAVVPSSMTKAASVSSASAALSKRIVKRTVRDEILVPVYDDEDNDDFHDTVNFKDSRVSPKWTTAEHHSHQVHILF